MSDPPELREFLFWTWKISSRFHHTWLMLRHRLHDFVMKISDTSKEGFMDPSQNARPPWGPNSFIVMQFSGKLAKLN